MLHCQTNLLITEPPCRLPPCEHGTQSMQVTFRRGCSVDGLGRCAESGGAGGDQRNGGGRAELQRTEFFSRSSLHRTRSAGRLLRRLVVDGDRGAVGSVGHARLTPVHRRLDQLHPHPLLILLVMGGSEAGRFLFLEVGGCVGGGGGVGGAGRGVIADGLGKGTADPCIAGAWVSRSPGCAASSSRHTPRPTSMTKESRESMMLSPSR